MQNVFGRIAETSLGESVLKGTLRRSPSSAAQPDPTGLTSRACPSVGHRHLGLTHAHVPPCPEYAKKWALRSISTGGVAGKARIGSRTQTFPHDEDHRMLLLILGLLVFFAIHMVPTSPELRQGMVERFGAGPYKVIFSVFSLLGLALIVYGYHKLQINPGKNPVLWDPPSWTRHIAFLLMIPAFILLVAFLVPSRIRTIAKHPMLGAIKFWALAHLLTNGDLGALVLFGSFLAFAVYDRISVKHRAAPNPLGSAAGGPLNDVIVVVGGLALYALMLFWGHGVLIGVPLVSA